MKIHKFLGSITRQITLLVVCLVLPLNILVLAATGVSMDAVQRHSVQSIEATAALYRQQLDGEFFCVPGIDAQYYADHDYHYMYVAEILSAYDK